MRKFGRVITLALLSAVTAEFLLGDQWLAGVASPGNQAVELLLYLAFYGSAAILIREGARRSGRGWPTILLLAFAFGVIEEGFVDQSLFNPNFAGQHLLAFGFIPGLAIGGPWTIFVLTLHVVWSIGSPIAIAEALFPHPLGRRSPVSPQTQAPWIGVPGLVIAGTLLLLGGAAIVFATVVAAGFAASALQYLVAAFVAGAAIVAAFLVPRRVPRTSGPYWWSVLVALAATSAFVALQRLPHDLSPWLACILLLAVLAVGGVLAAVLRLDVLGLATGAVLTYCWVGLAKAVPLGVFPASEQYLLVGMSIAVLYTAYLLRGQRVRVTPTPAGVAL